MPTELLDIDTKAEYASAWRTDVEEARRAALLPSCAKTLLALWAATFFLQVITALLRQYVNPDGITYLHVADLLWQGNLEEGFSNFGVNTFLYMLVFFKWLGLDPFSAGVWWNAVMASLAVLPLFGWVRRLFDLRLAIIASLLYAFHPIILSIGSAIMRGPMFWLFFNITIYAAWRAVTEVRLRWFLLAGCGLTLAIHTRSEAWFLLIPILLWTLWRFWFAAGYRIKLVFGTLLLMAIVPGSIAVMNWTVLTECPQWGIFRPSHAEQLTSLYKDTKEKIEEYRTEDQDDTEPSATEKSTSSGTKKATPKTSSPPQSSKKKRPPKKAEEPEAPPSFAKAGLRRALLRVAKSYSYLYGIFGLIGAFVWRGRRRFALHAMLLMAVPLFIVVWYRSCESDVSPRYFLPIVFISFPIIAIGLLWVAQKVNAIFDRIKSTGTETERASSRKPLYCLIGVLAFTLVVSGFGTVWGSNISEQKECELGKWILRTFGPDQRIYCFNRKSRLAAWYANTDRHSSAFYPVYGPNRKETPQWRLRAVFEKVKPRVVLCWANYRRPQEMTGLFESLEKNDYFGYELVQTGVLEAFEPKVLVLVRKDSE